MANPLLNLVKKHMDAKRAPPEPDAPEGAEDGEEADNEDDARKENAAQTLIQAVESKDTKGVVEAFSELFQVFEGEPHSEGEEVPVEAGDEE
jgi:hypothetical protein